MSPNSERAIDEGRFVEIDGVEQWITIRGANRDNPALLLVGGPGAAFTAFAPLFAPWEARFTLVQWDQPGAGATHGKNGVNATGPITLERIARDGIAVAELACRTLGKQKVGLLCFSGGTIVGLMMIKRRPELFSAYVGSGQVVDWARQDALSYELLLDEARKSANRPAIADLERIGPPPYADTATDAVKSRYAGAMTDAERAAMSALDPDELVALQSPPAEAAYIAPGVPLEDPRTRAMAVYAELRDEIVAFDARTLGSTFDVPMFFFQGDRDVFTVTSEVRDYAAEIQAPQKAFVLVEGAGHSTLFMRDALLRLLDAHVRETMI